MLGILGKKLGMTRIFQDDGCVIPITVVECTPNTITQIKTTEKDGYPAIVLGFSELKKPTKNKKFYHSKEFKVEDASAYKKGDKLTLEALKEVKEVKITGISKGKGFQGVMKKFHFAGGPDSHGHVSHRRPGSIGCRAKPGRVEKGKKMPGHLGSVQITKRNIPVVYMDIEKHLIGLKGPVPGPSGNLIIIEKSI
jgi:large subunit ribosomal protein L3